jgi:ParB family transcriptional regulator, chromosome partitioning protein
MNGNFDRSDCRESRYRVVTGCAADECAEEEGMDTNITDVEGNRNKDLVRVNPFRCRMWAQHDRLDEYITDVSCKLEIESFSKHGQLVPVLGRPVHGDKSCDIELIFGARRLFVARYLKSDLNVRVREMTDREALIAMNIENRQRQDISAYERGLSYARSLRLQIFQTQEDLARELQVSPSQVSRLLKLSRLPAIVVGAFESPFDISELWGIELATAWEDESRRPLLTKHARAIARMSHRPSASNIYEQLTASAIQSRKLQRVRRDEVVLDGAGKPLFRFKRQRKALVISLPIGSVSATVLTRLRECLADILQQQC